MIIPMEAGDTYPDDDASSIQQEHKDLAESIRALSDQIDVYCNDYNKYAPHDLRQIVASLQELLNIAKRHFQHEEKIMSINGFSGLVLHKRDHDYLIQSLKDFICSLSHGKIPLSADAGQNLRSWLIYHVKKYDGAYLELTNLDQ
jgi:hemerythrin-like metal-binding protein